MKLVNNTLIIEDAYINDGFFSQEETEYLKNRFNDQGNFYLSTEREIKYIIESTSLKAAEEFISTEFNSDDVIISYNEIMDKFLVKLKNSGFSGNCIAPAVLVAIHKVYCNVKRAEKMVKYMKAMGFGLHKEAD